MAVTINKKKRQTTKRSNNRKGHKHLIPSDPVPVCKYRDREISQTECRPCGGRKNQGIYECAMFGECTDSPSLHPIPDDLKTGPHEFYNRGRTVLQDCSNCPLHTSKQKPLVNVTVAIISHNYGHFLDEAIRSVRCQTVTVREIILVDSASTDDTWSRMESYKINAPIPKKTCIQNTGGHVWDARKKAFDVCDPQSEWIIFLDADDTLPFDYVEKCLNVAERHKHDCAIVYTDLQKFGDNNTLLRFQEEHNIASLHRNNYIHAGSMVRTEAIKVTDAMNLEEPYPIMKTADWVLWRRVLINGWSAYKQNNSPYLYRSHGEQMSNAPPTSYYESAFLEQAPVTIVVPYSGREWSPDVIDWLNHQDRKKFSKILFLLDDRSSALPQVEGYDEVTYCRIPPSNISPSLPRETYEMGRAVDSRMCQLYGYMYDRITTTYTMIVEDDIRPPRDALTKLLKGMEQWIDSITGIYPNRHHPDEGLVMLPSGKCSPKNYKPLFEIEPCLSSGFGCILFRTECFDRPFRTSPIGGWYDLRFFEESNLQHMVHWGVECGHAQLKASWELSATPVQD